MPLVPVSERDGEKPSVNSAARNVNDLKLEIYESPPRQKMPNTKRAPRDHPTPRPSAPWVCAFHSVGQARGTASRACFCLSRPGATHVHHVTWHDTIDGARQTVMVLPPVHCPLPSLHAHLPQPLSTIRAIAAPFCFRSAITMH